MTSHRRNVAGDQLVSIIIPTYNRRQFIERAVVSALQQSLVTKEVIVIDDGSTDDTQNVIAKYRDTVRYIRRSRGGASAARNTGWLEARGNYVIFLDSDETITSGKSVIQIEALESDTNSAMVYSESAVNHRVSAG